MGVVEIYIVYLFLYVLRRRGYYLLFIIIVLHKQTKGTAEESMETNPFEDKNKFRSLAMSSYIKANLHA